MVYPAGQSKAEAGAAGDYFAGEHSASGFVLLEFLVFKAHRRVYHSTLGLRVIKKKKEGARAAVGPPPPLSSKLGTYPAGQSKAEAGLAGDYFAGELLLLFDYSQA